MLKKILIFTLSVAILGLFFASCGFVKKEGGKVKVFMKDAPLDLEKVDHIYITFTAIKAHKAGQSPWITLFEGEKTVDLKELMEKKTLITEVELEKGTYTQLRLEISSGNIEVDGETHELQIPSGEVKIPCVFTVEQSDTVSIVLDFSAQDSIKVIEAGKAQRYILRPVIRVEAVTYE